MTNTNFNRKENWQPTGPCYNCPDRYVGCHSSCAKYISYLQDLEAKRKMVYESKRRMADYEHKNYLINKCQKNKRRKHKYGK